MTTQGRNPAIAGVGQLVQRDVDLDHALDPLDMLVQVARSAADDAGGGERLLQELDLIGIVDVVAWRPQNAPRLLAERLGASPRRELVTAIGGEIPLTLVNHVAEEIAHGRVRAAFIGGSSTVRTLRNARKAKVKLEFPQGGEGEPELFGENKNGASELEMKYGLVMPIHIYPIFENALRAHRGLSIDEHQRRVGALMSRFTKVAAANPYAWFPVERSAEELSQATDENRMIAFPYTKYLNAVLETDQAAGVLLLSRDAARDHGISEDRLVHWWGGASGVEAQWFVSERPTFYSCPAMQQTLLGALERSGSTIDEVQHIDFYSCFPIAVEMACDALGLAEDDPRGFTLTGGLPYAGGPGNNYTLHSLATLVERLRGDPGTRGLVSGNGWYLTKHSAGVYSTEPPPHDVAAAKAPEPAAPADAVEPVVEAEGDATVETYTVHYGRDGAPSQGIVIGRLGNGQRFIANTDPAREALESLVETERVGSTGRVSHVDGKNLFEPR
jgi:acetyl-CoA C-acetyltransferase